MLTTTSAELDFSYFFLPFIASHQGQVQRHVTTQKYHSLRHWPAGARRGVLLRPQPVEGPFLPQLQAGALQNLLGWNARYS